ncbi:MAG: fumarylacetoacetate hydrolase family protein [Opitutaceae bacterium]
MKTPLLTLSAALAAFAFSATASFAAPAPSQVAVIESVTYKPSEVITLWPGLPPGDKEGAYGPEHVLPDRPRPFDQITNVTVPTLSVFLPKPEKNTGTAMLVIPGGGLARLAIEHEGYEIAEWLNAQGIAVFMLKYRVPARDPQARYKVGLQDAQRAMGIIRSRAAEWKIDSDSVGSIGFSAGGEINVMLSVFHAEPRQYDPIDAADKFSTRPDFNIPIYGGGFTTRDALRPDIASRINATTPPMFIAHAFDDAAMSSIILIGALKRANIASELHIFGAGGHGFGIRGTGLPVGHWGELCLNWLAWQGYLDAAPVRTFARDLAKARMGNVAALPSFSAAVPKADLNQAFAAQRRVVQLAMKDGAQVAGYKAAYATSAAQKTAKVNQPVHGVLFKAGRINATAGTPVSIKASKPLLVETEIGYVISVDIGTKLVVPRQALTTIEAIVPVIELPFDAKTANASTKAYSAIDTVAGNVGSNQYIVGAPLSPKVVGNTDALGITLTRNGKNVHTTTGADVKDGQALMLMTLINQIIDQGRVLHAGDIIISGALGGASPGEKGSYTADFGKLGNIAFTIE